MSVLSRQLLELTPTRVDGVMNLLIVPSRLPDTAKGQRLPSQAVRDNYLRDMCFISKVNDEWIGTAYRVRDAASGVGTLCRMVVRRTNDSNPFINERLISDLSWLVSTSRVDHTNFHQVVDGVVHFWADPYTIEGGFTHNYGFTNRLLPAYIDLELAVLEPSAVAKFRARMAPGVLNPTPAATAYLEKQIGRTHVFRQRVAIKARASEND